ncbi:hypothetical protein H8Z72_23550 (plasmid) [Xanthomonas citri pv. citri]|uniref:hypothetical protein n=1 Tax=Xanthomonas citri TaxID=346 RepID=UPI0019338D45|nr:hypothetical protein [Xanthomonas citri]QRD62710.1 hypothetical protein H8Z74_22635 [Xanthomonas citri pv. citri]QRD67037.1 hypothetical protein H8Z73_22720 [Xanthomonas citri pv. citri]QRD71710.1 hypothetical protein H8Z72_23550 [Xanthomonas citri pv. citri]
MSYSHIHRHLLLAAALVVAVASCSKTDEARINARTQATLTASVDQMRAGITDRADLDKLDLALSDVARFSIDPVDVMTEATKGRLPTREEVFERVKGRVDGLSHPDLMTLASTLRTKYEQQLTSDDKALRELRTRRAQVERAAEKLARFAVVAADYANQSEEPSPLGGALLHLKLTVQNDLDVPVSKAVMMVTFGPDGGATPWLSQRVEQTFQTPLPPGKTAQVELFSAFAGAAQGAADIKPVLDAAVLELSGAGGDVIVQAPRWGQGDATRLNVLEVASEYIRTQLELKPDAARTPGI